MKCTLCAVEETTGKSYPHYPCGNYDPLTGRIEAIESEPPQWQDGDWWKSTNSIRDVGEQHALARREANRMRRAKFFANRMRRATFGHGDQR